MIRGVCGKSPETAAAQDTLTSELVRLAIVLKARGAPLDGQTAALIREGLFTCVTNVNFDTARILALAKEVSAANGWIGGCSACSKFQLTDLWKEPEDVRSLKSLILFGLRGMAAYAYHAAMLGETDAAIDAFFIEGLSILGEDRKCDYLAAELKRLGMTNLRCMEMLDRANTNAYGEPTIVKVSRTSSAWSAAPCQPKSRNSAVRKSSRRRRITSNSYRSPRSINQIKTDADWIIF